MRIVGEYNGGKRCTIVAVGGMVTLNVDSAHVETYSGDSVYTCDKCYVSVQSGYYNYNIKMNNGEYMTPDIANGLILELAEYEFVNLEQHDMALYDAVDVRPDSIAIRNDCEMD